VRSIHTACAHSRICGVGRCYRHGITVLAVLFLVLSLTRTALARGPFPLAALLPALFLQHRLVLQVQVKQAVAGRGRVGTDGAVWRRTRRRTLKGCGHRRVRAVCGAFTARRLDVGHIYRGGSVLCWGGIKTLGCRRFLQGLFWRFFGSLVFTLVLVFRFVALFAGTRARRSSRRGGGVINRAWYGNRRPTRNLRKSSM